MKRLLTTLLITQFLAAQLAAQGFSALVPGDRVRVWTNDLRKKPGEITAVSADALEVQFDGNRHPLVIPRLELTRLDISRGGRTRRDAARASGKHGAAIGAGALMVLAAFSPDVPKGSRLPATMSSSIAGSALGLIVGSIVGAFRGGEKWERVW
jgi:hypothetical protein